jgi:two-component system sensor histidine kinase QseC
MKLLSKITFWYIAIIFVISSATMYISRNTIASHIKANEVARLTAQNDSVGRVLQAGTTSINMEGIPMAISKFNGSLPPEKNEVQESTHYNSLLDRNEHRLIVNSYYQVGADVYKVSSYNYVTRTYLYFNSMLWTLTRKLTLIAVAVIIMAGLLSRYILSPFRKTMKAIRGFDITKKQKLQLAATSTREFKELNSFLVEMTDKAAAEYAAVKEFSENASHELQTPLAVMQSKLELLSETNIDEPQAALIADMQNSIGKLTSINRSLTLLTKLENHEFKPSQVKFCKVVSDVLDMYADRIELKHIDVRSTIGQGVHLNIHPTLAEILVNNLFSNAIRHNIEGGSIILELNEEGLYIANTGNPPDLPTEELFQRFRKSNQSTDSTGLGLAIVKQICQVSKFDVQYEYRDQWHYLNVCFNNS